MMILTDLLTAVQKPARYIGGEWNSVRKEWAPDKVKFLLAFPDVYEVGMSYLGLKILYGILNKREDSLAERVFSPWTDFEEALRKNGMGLLSLESKRPIREFDIIGFSLAYELTFTNVLTILDLGGIPKRSSERDADDPLVIAGGPSCCNPEPMAEFFDAFLIGDGEEAIGEIVEAYKGYRVQCPGSREMLLRELARIRGVYVPALYRVEYASDRTMKSFSPIDKDAPRRIEKRTVSDLDSAYYPTDQIVPNIQVVHDRIAIEIMRGCKHACRFCQASRLYRPCRERSVGKILELARETYRMTGYDEISLLSLSSGDHSKIVELIEELNKEFTKAAVSVSVPSLRVEEVLKDLPALISKVRKSGLTFAPEAGSERLREFIGKNIAIDKLYRAALESFKAGWRRVKLYFMIGLPTETEEDVLAIAELIRSISDLKIGFDGRPAYVAASVNAFVPKPHTAFQREGMDHIERLKAKTALLRRAVRSRTSGLDFHSLDMSLLEAALSRGDRALSGVIYDAWRRGARFDSWQDLFRPDVWQEAFRDSGIDPAFYATRMREPDELLPWSFIDT